MPLPNTLSMVPLFKNMIKIAAAGGLIHRYLMAHVVVCAGANAFQYPAVQKSLTVSLASLVRLRASDSCGRIKVAQQ